MPLVTIGLPVFNGEKYLERSLDAILAQTYENIELVISDNASTDRTESICRRYAAKHQKIRYSRNDANIGVFRNNNKVIELGTGEYFMLAGHDDLRSPEQIARCVAVLEENPQYVMAYVATTYIGENDEELDIKETVLDVGSPDVETRFRQIFRLDHKIEPGYGLVRYSALSKIRFGQYPDSDRNFIAELGLRGPFFRVSESLFFRRDHSGSTTQKNSGRYESSPSFDPGGNGRFFFPYFWQGIHYCQAITRSELKLRDKARCLSAMVTWTRQHRRQLINDVKHFLHCVIPRPLLNVLKKVASRRTQ
jgi:glycosyltransferase involved in cell wall biosynthesis